jgi:hypothetical protein
MGWVAKISIPTWLLKICLSEVKLNSYLIVLFGLRNHGVFLLSPTSHPLYFFDTTFSLPHHTDFADLG